MTNHESLREAMAHLLAMAFPHADEIADWNQPGVSQPVPEPEHYSLADAVIELVERRGDGSGERRCGR